MKNIYILLIIILVIISSCNNDIIYEDEYIFSDGEWNILENINFKFEIKDTKQNYNLFFDFNNSDRIKTSNIWFYVSVISPKGTIQKDSIEYILCDEQGQWYGKHTGNHVNNKFLYQKGIKFPESGIYRIQLEQGMRENDTPLVKSLGFIIEKN